MKTVNKIAIQGEEYNIAFTHIEGYEQVKNFFEKKNPTRVELFRDDDGKLYTVDAGDLEVLWLRQNTPRIRAEENNKIEMKKPPWMIQNEYQEMLDSIKLDL